jgi:RNA recognition motif-containing protein
MCNIFVANLPISVTLAEVKELFAPFGCVKGVKLLTDYRTGRSKGVGFIELDSVVADQAIESLRQKKVEGRQLVVDFAHPSFQPTTRFGKFGTASHEA